MIGSLPYSFRCQRRQLAVCFAYTCLCIFSAGGAFAAPIVAAISFSNGSAAVGNTADGDGGVAYASLSLGNIIITSNSTLRSNKAGGNGAYAKLAELCSSYDCA